MVKFLRDSSWEILTASSLDLETTIKRQLNRHGVLKYILLVILIKNHC